MYWNEAILRRRNSWIVSPIFARWLLLRGAGIWLLTHWLFLMLGVIEVVVRPALTAPAAERIQWGVWEAAAALALSALDTYRRNELRLFTTLGIRPTSALLLLASPIVVLELASGLSGL